MWSLHKIERGIGMKKICCVLLLVAFAIATPALAAEITFRGIPWYSSPKECFDALYPGEPYCAPQYEGISISVIGDENFGCDYEIAYCSNAGFEMMDLGYYDIDVGGYDVSSMFVEFMYGVTDGVVSQNVDDSQLVSASYFINAVDRFAVMSDLKSKLTTLYGEPMELHDKMRFINADYMRMEDKLLWIGDNDAAVMLEMVWHSLDGVSEEKQGFSTENYVILSYGKTDIADELNLIDDYWESEALKSEQASILESALVFDGL